MTVLLLPVMIVLTVGCGAFLTYLVTDAELTRAPRENMLTAINGPTEEQYKRDMADYQRRVQDAMLNDTAIPADAPPPPAQSLIATLIQCRWCAGLWISIVVTIIARLALTADYLPLWHSTPLHPLDWLIIPAWACANAYAIGFLASREGN